MFAGKQSILGQGRKHAGATGRRYRRDGERCRRGREGRDTAEKDVGLRKTTGADWVREVKKVCTSGEKMGWVDAAAVRKNM